MGGDPLLVQPTARRASEFPVTTGNLRHNSQRSNDSANPVPIRGPLVRIPPERQEGGRRKRSDWPLAAFINRPPWEAAGSGGRSYLAEKRRREGEAYGDDVGIAPGQDVAAAEDGAHRVD